MIKKLQKFCKNGKTRKKKSLETKVKKKDLKKCTEKEAILLPPPLHLPLMKKKTKKIVKKDAIKDKRVKNLKNSLTKRLELNKI